jgi:ubiquinone/menaquinone biosynthesis C-methylase UbiE
MVLMTTVPNASDNYARAILAQTYPCPEPETDPGECGSEATVPRYVRLRELLVGVEGLALLRQLFEGDDEGANTRIDEVRRIVCDGEEMYDLGIDVPVVDARSGYARWAETYDRPGNPLIFVEQPVVWSLLADLPVGDAIDAACGTGRHTRRLVELGHRAVGVDGSPEMLDVARAAVPEADFRGGDLTALPVESSSADLVVCALALEHVASLDVAITELARVVRPAGRVVLSDLHPALRALGGAAYFQDAAGGAGVVQGHSHLFGDYLRAFEKAQLVVRGCHEPRFGTEEAMMQRPAAHFVPAATQAAYSGLPAALIWDLSAPAS